MAAVTLADTAICHVDKMRARRLHVASNNTWFPLVAVGIEDTHGVSRVYCGERLGGFVVLFCRNCCFSSLVWSLELVSPSADRERLGLDIVGRLAW